MIFFFFYLQMDAERGWPSAEDQRDVYVARLGLSACRRCGSQAGFLVQSVRLNFTSVLEEL